MSIKLLPLLRRKQRYGANFDGKSCSLQEIPFIIIHFHYFTPECCLIFGCRLFFHNVESSGLLFFAKIYLVSSLSWILYFYRMDSKKSKEFAPVRLWSSSRLIFLQFLKFIFKLGCLKLLSLRYEWPLLARRNNLFAENVDLSIKLFIQFLYFGI